MLHILSLPLGASGASVSGRVSIVVLSSVIQWFCCPCRMTRSISARCYSAVGCGSTTRTVGLCIAVFGSIGSTCPGRGDGIFLECEADKEPAVHILIGTKDAERAKGR